MLSQFDRGHPCRAGPPDPGYGSVVVFLASDDVGQIAASEPLIQQVDRQ